MFKEIGALMGLMKNLPKIREEMEGLQTKLPQITAEADAGGGMVKVKINGVRKLVSIQISDELLKDKEMLEDVVVSAVNAAMDKINVAVAEETTKMATGLGLPAGMNLPGLS
jgi:DNA-binding YbaB/EbfC family protein